MDPPQPLISRAFSFSPCWMHVADFGRRRGGMVRRLVRGIRFSDRPTLLSLGALDASKASGVSGHPFQQLNRLLSPFESCPRSQSSAHFLPGRPLCCIGTSPRTVFLEDQLHEVGRRGRGVLFGASAGGCSREEGSDGQVLQGFVGKIGVKLLGVQTQNGF